MAANDHGSIGTFTPQERPAWASEATNLANARLGAAILFATDEWFATAERLLDPSPATFDPALFSPHGKTMDGWESRRRRQPGHDWCIIKLGLPGRVLGLEIDTAFFTGNQVPKISIEWAELSADKADGTSWPLPGASARLARGSEGPGVQGTAELPATIERADAATKGVGQWRDLVPVTRLEPGYKDRCVHFFPTPNAPARCTHLRVNYFPDGGVARLRVWGDVSRDFATELQGKVCDLAFVGNGGRGVGCSNRHYGEPKNLIQPGRGVNMGDGWETGRHQDRGPIIRVDPLTGLTTSTASDWAVLQLGAVAGSVTELHLDTHFFKGNFPESVKVDACCAPMASAADILASCDSGHGHGASKAAAAHHHASSGMAVEWFPLLERTRVGPDAEHVFRCAGDHSASGHGPAHAHARLAPHAIGRPVSHVRVTIFPDGGIMRVKVVGKAVSPMGAPLPAASHAKARL